MIEKVNTYLKVERVISTRDVIWRYAREGQQRRSLLGMVGTVEGSSVAMWAQRAMRRCDGGTNPLVTAIDS
jgi:hypothetical protein